MIFADRVDAGKQLAVALMKYKGQKDTLILGLPRGGVVVAYEIAKALKLPLDVICPRKVGAPFNPELAVGAVTETGKGILNTQLIRELGISQDYLQATIERETHIAEQRLASFRKNRPPRNLKGKTIILVDDGLATGSTMKAAIETSKSEFASRIVVAVPIAPADTITEMESLVDEVICLDIPAYFMAIGQFYENFAQVNDAEVTELLRLKTHSIH